MEAGDSFYDNLSDYSDDFEDDESSVKANQPPPVPSLDFHSTSTPRRTNQYHESSFTARANKTEPIFRKAKSQYMSGRKGSKMNRSSVKGRGRAVSEMKTATKQSSMFSPRDRELSAKRHAIKKLENSLSETKRELTDLKKENRLLNRLQIRQEKELTRFQTQEGELPEILSRHAEEVRALKEQLKRSQESSHSYQQQAKDLHQELLRVNNRKKKLEEVAKRKHLLEREKLTLQLQDTNEQLQGREKRISELERGIEAMNKNHSQEVRSLMLKNKALSNEAEDLRHNSQRLHAQLKEKEREMDVLNIYTQRLGKNAPPRLSTRIQAPITDSVESQTVLSCPPSKNVSLQTKPGLKSSGSQTDLPLPKPPVSVTATSTQTDIVASPRNESLEVSNSPQTLPQPPAPKPVSVGGNSVPIDSLKLRGTPPKASTTGGEKPQESLQRQVEEQKKMELIATLKAMDAQKDPPASQPVTSVAVKSTAQPTANVTVGGDRLGEKVIKQEAHSSTQPAASAKVGDSNTEEEAKRKKLLLAKLMAIDEGSDPSKVTMSKMDVSKASRPSKHSASGHKSTTSIQSWPETVENMYNGKPAFATDEDPFGSRNSSGRRDAPTKAKSFFLTEGEGEGAKTKKHGRRRQPEQSNLLNFNSDDVIGRSNKVTAKVAVEQASTPPTATAQTQLAGYQPSFGRRAQGQHATKPKNGMIFGDFDIVQSTAKKTEPPSSLAIDSGAEKREHGEGTRRDYPWETKVNVSTNPQRVGRERETETNKSDAGPLSSPSMVFGYVGQHKPLLESGSKGALLPLREKKVASPMPTSSYDVTEPDDLEELAL